MNVASFDIEKVNLAVKNVKLIFSNYIKSIVIQDSQLSYKATHYPKSLNITGWSLQNTYFTLQKTPSLYWK